MEIIRDIPDNKRITRPIAIALGNFDGVHRGHQQLIKQCVRESKEQGWGSCVLTFEPHPALVLTNNQEFKLLNTYEQKYQLLGDLGVDYLYLLSFNYALAGMPPEQFIQRYLLDTIQVQKVYVGYNFTFGDKGSGTASTLQEVGRQKGFAVSVLEPVTFEKEVVSSSLIREKYRDGEITKTAQLLGYWPLLEGPVITGEQRGRKMGFPTANLEIPDYILLPSFGVYAAYIAIKGQQYFSVVNIGVKPTFGGVKPTIEAYILDYQDNLYEEKLCLQLVRRIRAEKKFSGLEELKAQITRDVQKARQILSEEMGTFTNKIPFSK